MTIIESNYERVTARCPNGHVNVYNRVSDLGRRDVIEGMKVRCQKCGIEYWICGDSIDPAYKMLLLDCHELRAQKRYMYCILNICQAYEMFFSFYFRSLLYHAYRRDKNLEQLNALLSALRSQIDEFTFANLRCNFLRSAVMSKLPDSLVEVAAAIQRLDPGDKDASTVDLDACSDPELREKLQVIKSTKVNRLRNKVVHKLGYRPTLEDVSNALDEAEGVLFVIPSMLGVIDNERVSFIE